ncbi:MAG TPA: hypothetical protein PKE47_10220, partial [Verrucomicrobiota bacterium]|nr:hypothetical protein [Verrucomicrobiota bacterium]
CCMARRAAAAGRCCGRAGAGGGAHPRRGRGAGGGFSGPALGCRLATTPAALDRALAEADVVNLLRIQHERQRRTMFPGVGEYRALFGLDAERLRRLKPDVLIMHPGPINRGVEIDADTADGPRSVILEQVTNGVAVRMAVLYLVSGGDPALARS